MLPKDLTTIMLLNPDKFQKVIRRQPTPELALIQPLLLCLAGAKTINKEAT